MPKGTYCNGGRVVGTRIAVLATRGLVEIFRRGCRYSSTNRIFQSIIDKLKSNLLVSRGVGVRVDIIVQRDTISQEISWVETCKSVVRHILDGALTWGKRVTTRRLAVTSSLRVMFRRLSL